MKKTISLIAALLFSLSGAFAIKLPDGTNVRAKEVTTYESGALRSVDVGGTSGYRNSPGEGVEIATPIGKMLVWGKIYYYEDGSVKSVKPCNYSELNKAVTVQTNFGTLTFGEYGAGRITFYQSGALWYIDSGAKIPYEEGRVLPFEEKGQVTDCAYNYEYVSGSMIQPAQKPSLALYYPNGNNYAQTAAYTGKIRKRRDNEELNLFSGGFQFYDSGRSDYAIIREASLPYCTYLTFKTKAGEFKAGNNGSGASVIKFYRDGTIWNGSIKLLDQENGIVKTSLDDIFGGYGILLWQDGSIRECSTDEVMIETIYGKKVQIPRYGRLAFRKDGSVCAYSTELQTEYTVGKRTYTANKEGELKRKVADTTQWKEDTTFNSIRLNENNEIDGMGFDSYSVNAFYPSGAVWKYGEYRYEWFSEDGEHTARIDHLGRLKLGSLPRYESWDSEYKTAIAKLPVGECIRNIYFGADGKPESYDCYKTVQNLSLTWTNTTGNYEASDNDYVSDDKLEEYGVPTNFLEVDDDGNYIPDETRHPITLKEVQ